MAGRPLSQNGYHEREKAVVHTRVDPELRNAFKDRVVADGDTLTAAFERAMKAYLAATARDEIGGSA